MKERDLSQTQMDIYRLLERAVTKSGFYVYWFAYGERESASGIALSPEGVEWRLRNCYHSNFDVYPSNHPATVSLDESGKAIVKIHDKRLNSSTYLPTLQDIAQSLEAEVLDLTDES